MPGALLILPTYNEAGNIGRLIQELQNERLDLDILVVDDNSPDGTGVLAERLATQAPITVIHRSEKQGLGSAHRLGLQYAMAHQYRFAITMDADFAHSPRYLRQMLAMASRSDVVIGSRYAPGGDFYKIGILRPLISWTIHWFATWLLHLPYDCTGGLRLYRVQALRGIDLKRIRSTGHAFLIEILSSIKQNGFSIQEFPVVIQPRREGKSKVSRFEMLQEAMACLRFFLTLRLG